MQSRYQDMIDAYEEMQQLLTSYDIDIKKTAIFEETIMKAAGIHSESATCVLTVNEITVQMGFEISGITREEAVGFKDFLAITIGAESVDMMNDHKGSYIFPVTQAQVKNKLAPFFVTEVKKIDQDKLEAYRLLSVNSEVILLHKLDILFAEIILLSAELQSSDISEYVKGQLNIILDKILIPGLSNYHNNHKGHGCEMAKAAVGQTEVVLEMYADILDHNEVLGANESARKLLDDVDKYISNAERIGIQQERQLQEEKMRLQGLLQQMGMFGQQGRQQTAVLNLSNLNPYASSSSSESSDEESEDKGFMASLRSVFGMRK